MFDYPGGKQNWLANGLAAEGSRPDSDRIGSVARKDIPTCRPGGRVGDVLAQLQGSDWNECLVLNEQQVVLGRFRPEEGRAPDPDARVEDVMHEGPSTFRPNVSLHELARFMDEHGLMTTIVTTAEGKLVGGLRRADLGHPGGAPAPPVD